MAHIILNLNCVLSFQIFSRQRRADFREWSQLFTTSATITFICRLEMKYNACLAFYFISNNHLQLETTSKLQSLVQT